MNGSVFKKVLSVRIKGKGRIKAKDVFALSSHTALLRNGFMEVGHCRSYEVTSEVFCTWFVTCVTRQYGYNCNTEIDSETFLSI